ncbi:MAG: hypothetical protein RhofKO_25880 [Rhodothermales bacterium]
MSAYLDISAYDTLIEDMKRGALREALDALEVTGQAMVAYLTETSAAFGMQPGLRANAPDRPAHVGGWANVSGDLESSYAYQVLVQNGRATLRLTNTSGHAIYVEAMEGYFVLQGIADSAGDPAVVRLREEISRRMPGWEVRV